MQVLAFAGELLSNAEGLLRDGLHTSEVADGYSKAAAKVSQPGCICVAVLTLSSVQKASITDCHTNTVQQSPTSSAFCSPVISVTCVTASHAGAPSLRKLDHQRLRQPRHQRQTSRKLPLYLLHLFLLSILSTSIRAEPAFQVSTLPASSVSPVNSEHEYQSRACFPGLTKSQGQA